MKLIKNKANHTTPEMIKQTEEMFTKISRYVNTFQVKSITKKELDPESFGTLSDVQVKKSSELG